MGITILRPDIAQVIAIGSGVEMTQGGGGDDPYADYLVYDTFTDANGTSLASHTPEKDVVSGGWTLHNGTFDIQSNRANKPTATAGRYTASIDSGQAGVRVRCVVRFTVEDAGVAVRITNNDNLWQAILEKDKNQFNLVEVNGGTSTTRASIAKTLAINTDYTIEVLTNGTTIVATVDGGSQISYASATLNQTGTRHGIRSRDTGDQFDDFTIEAYTPP